MASHECTTSRVTFFDNDISSGSTLVAVQTCRNSNVATSSSLNAERGHPGAYRASPGQGMHPCAVAFGTFGCTLDFYRRFFTRHGDLTCGVWLQLYSCTAVVASAPRLSSPRRGHVRAFSSRQAEEGGGRLCVVDVVSGCARPVHRTLTWHRQQERRR